MTKLKVTDLQSEEVAKKDVVEVGQVRKGVYGNIGLVIKAPPTIPNGEGPFSILLLTSTKYSYELSDDHNTETEEEILQRFPTLLDAELTYKEAK